MAALIAAQEPSALSVDFVGATMGLESLPFAAVHESLHGT
jgi:hypothetical protein